MRAFVLLEQPKTCESKVLAHTTLFLKDVLGVSFIAFTGWFRSNQTGRPIQFLDFSANAYSF